MDAVTSVNAVTCGIHFRKLLAWSPRKSHSAAALLCHANRVASTCILCLLMQVAAQHSNSTEAVNILSALVCLALRSGAIALMLCADRSDALIVKCEEMQVDGASRWKLTDVVGEEDGLGIECLSGSGAIAR